MKTYGKRLGTTAAVLCNLTAYAILRHVSRRNREWLQSGVHWYMFPFSLRNRALWSPSLRAWFCPADEVAIEGMLKLPQYEPVDWVAPGPGEVFIDVGAYIGWYSIKAARAVGASGRVVALEPDKINRQQLERNLSLNGIENVTVRPLAAWSRSGAVGWHASNVPVWHSASENHAGLPCVEATSIDDLVAQMALPRLDWVKVDVEGAEVAVLEGSKDSLRRFRPSLFIEIHETFEAVTSFLSLYGYETVNLAFDQEPRKHGWVLARRSQ